MQTFQNGKSGDYAEVIIDFKKKKVDMFNPKNKKPFKKSRFHFNFNGLTGCILFAIGLILSFFGVPNLLWIIVGIVLTNYLIGIIFPKYNNWLDKWNQKIFVGTGSKSVVVVKDIKNKTWQLPYEFHNNVFNYYLYGDYKKYASKLHIKPKDYYIGTIENKTKQTKDWDAIISFDKVPKKGRMEIEFV